MEIVFATNNQNKVYEVQLLLPKNIKILSLKDIGCTVDIPETANTLEGNAILKANYVTEHYGFDCFADDTGLLVDSLNGEPGVLSARYAGDHKNSEDNISKLLQELSTKSNRKAHFETCIALNIDHRQLLFTGIAEGEITLEKHGDSGFGYDPVFKPKGYQKTFAELPIKTKNKISHRGKAMQKLINYFKTLQK